MCVVRKRLGPQQPGAAVALYMSSNGKIPAASETVGALYDRNRDPENGPFLSGGPGAAKLSLSLAEPLRNLIETTTGEEAHPRRCSVHATLKHLHDQPYLQPSVRFSTSFLSITST